jgi:hypothetical protein
MKRAVLGTGTSVSSRLWARTAAAAQYEWLGDKIHGVPNAIDGTDRAPMFSIVATQRSRLFSRGICISEGKSVLFAFGEWTFDILYN